MFMIETQSSVAACLPRDREIDESSLIKRGKEKEKRRDDGDETRALDISSKENHESPANAARYHLH